jgi:hypothetical protein
MSSVNLYDPQPSNPDDPSVIVETNEGRFIVTQSTGGWAGRTVYRGSVRKDPVASCLRGIAWSLGVPGGNKANVPFE